jgi:hypothetical protein
MKRIVATFLLGLACSALFAMAQVSPASVVAEIPFPFMIGDKTLSAGTYQFAMNLNLSSMMVTNTKGKEAAMAAVLTRLSPRSDKEASVVFDVVGNDHYMSEVYVPGHDGFQFKGAPDKHAHASVKATK